MESSLIQVFDKNKIGCKKSPRTDAKEREPAEEKSTIDKVFEDLEKETALRDENIVIKDIINLNGNGDVDEGAETGGVSSEQETLHKDVKKDSNNLMLHDDTDDRRESSNGFGDLENIFRDTEASSVTTNADDGSSEVDSERLRHNGVYRHENGDKTCNTKTENSESFSGVHGNKNEPIVEENRGDLNTSFGVDLNVQKSLMDSPSPIASTSGHVINTIGDAEYAINEYDNLESDLNSIYFRDKVSDDGYTKHISHFDSDQGNYPIDEKQLLERYKQMEQQQEVLNKSLISLSTHFAQVQLRLKQIINSPKNEQEMLLKNLEKFTFIGIPEVNELCLYNYSNGESNVHEQAESKSYIEGKLEFEKSKHKEMIGKLKTQLEQLENYVYEFSNNDECDIPTSHIINKQQIIIDELKEKLNLNINFHEEEQLRKEINNAIISPMKTKEDLILQLKTQISDLEKFINFLQSTQCKCTSMTNQTDMKNKTINIMKKISTILHIFAEHHSSNFKKTSTNAMKKSMKVNHYGDLRAQLEVAITHVIDVCRQPDQEVPIDSDYMSDTEDSVQCNSKVALAVRKHLAPCLQRLLQHGLVMNNSQAVSVVQYISCSSNQNKARKQVHIWDLISKYYEIKNGEDFNCKPNRKLSESFNLDIGNTNLGIKQSLLASIGNILAVHNKYKKNNPDSYFKSFVCDGLNKKLLVQWLHIILTYKCFLEEFYTPWSYVTTTKFTDAAESLQKLYEFHFNLAIVDVSIRNLQSIKDAF